MSFVRPHLEYASPVWAASHHSDHHYRKHAEICLTHVSQGLERAIYSVTGEIWAVVLLTKGSC